MVICGIIGGMKVNLKIRERAIALRKKGLSYNEIRKKLDNAVAKSTLSLWLKSVPLRPEHKQRLYTKQVLILSRGAQSQKERRKREINEIIEEARKEIRTPLSEETFRLFGAGIYWGEGSKTQDFEITNSDPTLIAFAVKLFSRVFGRAPHNMKAHLNLYPQQNETDIKRFWSEITQIPIKNFGKSFIKPLSKGYKKNNLYYGTIKVRVRKGTDMKYRVFGWLKAALQDTNVKVELTKKKWARITEVDRPPVNL